MEHVNHNNTLVRLRKAKKRLRDDAPSSEAGETRRGPVDTCGCANWQPKTLPDEQTEESLELKRHMMEDQFKHYGFAGADRRQLDEAMNVTYYLQRRTLNSTPSPIIQEVAEKWPFLFSQKYMCSHFMHLTGIPRLAKITESLTNKGRRIMQYFCSLPAKKDVAEIFAQIDAASDDSVRDPAVVLLLMPYFREKPESLFLLTDLSVCVTEYFQSVRNYNKTSSNIIYLQVVILQRHSIWYRTLHFAPQIPV